MRLENCGQNTAVSAPQVDNRAGGGEVIGSQDDVSGNRVEAGHGFRKALGLLRIFCVVLPLARSVDMIECNRTGLDAVPEFLPRCVVIPAEYLDGKRTQRARDVTTQCSPERRQRKATIIVLSEESRARQSAH